MFLALFVLVLAAALFFFANETISTMNNEEESFTALKVHIVVVCGLGIWCFLVFGTHCIRCGPIGGDAGCGMDYTFVASFPYFFEVLGMGWFGGGWGGGAFKKNVSTRPTDPPTDRPAI